MKLKSINELINNLNPLQIQKYLKATGWVSSNSRKSHIGIFTFTNFENMFEITLPLERNFKDYNEGIKIVIERISEVEKLEFDEVLNKLLLPVADIVRFRVENEDTLNGTISFDEGFSLLENAKRTLYTKACDLIQPEIYHQRLGFKKANEFINNCRLGQTQQGSYIASIVCPFIAKDNNDNTKQLSIFDSQESIGGSFTRQLTVNLMKSLQSLQNAIEQDSFIDIEKSGIPDFSGNFVESITKLSLKKPNSIIEITTDWAPIVPYSGNVSVIKFTQDHIAPAEGWVQKIKKEKAGKSGIFYGKISQVKTNPEPEQRTTVEFIINFLDDQNKKRAAQVIVPSDDLAFATDALKEGKMVKISGLLEGTKRKKISNPEIDIVD